MEESAVSRSTIIFRREVTGQFHSKLLLSLDTAKAEAIVFGPVKWKKKSAFRVIWFKFISKRDFNEEIFYSLSAALPYDPFLSVANNWHQYKL